MAVDKEYTEDTLFNGRVRCIQHQAGYRFSIDAVLLGNFVTPKPGDRILDLGCGSGVIPLILAYRMGKVRITGLEIQPDLAGLAKRNIALNKWHERIEIINGDLREIRTFVQAGSFDWVISNPPYRRPGSGRVNPGTEQAMARHEQTADRASVTKAACWAVKKRGRVVFIYPASRGAAVISELKNSGLEPKKILAIFSYPGAAASLLIIEAVKSGGEELTILPPFYVYEERNGKYSKEMTACYKP